MVDMLQFNPYLRPTAKELVALSYFDEVRDPEMENQSPFKLNLEVDTDEGYNCDKSFTRTELKQILKTRFCQILQRKK